MFNWTVRHRALALFIAILPFYSAASGSTVLIRSELRTPPDLGQVQTYSGKVDAVITPVKPSPALTIVLLTDSLSVVELESVKKDLLTLYISLRGHPMRVALLRNGSIGVAGPFSSRAQLKSALTEVAGNPDLQVAPAGPGVLDNLGASVAQLGADWSRVLLVGELPALEAPAREYAAALLARAFCAGHVQLSWYTFSGGDDSWLPLFRSTGGTIVHGSLPDFAGDFADRSTSFYEIDWTTIPPGNGFVVARAALSDLQGQPLFEGPDIAAAGDAALPTIDQYIGARSKLADANRLLAQEGISDASAQAIRDDLRAALGVNPLDLDALLTAADFSERLKDYSGAARYRTSLTQVRPQDATVYAALGHTLLEAGDFDGAEAPLQRALSLSLRTPLMAEDLARIRLAHKDDKAALPFLDEVLRADAKRQDLWFIQAQAAERTKDFTLAIHSYEEGLGVGGTHVPETASLAKLYIVGKRPEKAADLARRTMVGIPADAALRTEFAGSLDDLQMSGEALQAWKSVLAVDGNTGRAHLRVAQLLLGAGDARGAEDAAKTGLARLPKFPGLYVAKADALEKQGRFYDARTALLDGAANVQDSALLSRLALTEDTYGGFAAHAYAQWADSLSPNSPERVGALRRGFFVSLRDADLKQADAFAVLLASAGAAQETSLLGAEEKSTSGTLIPGGLDALAFAAHAKEGVASERFFVEYARAVIDRLPVVVTPSSKLYTEEVEQHFQRIAALEAFGKKEGNQLMIKLSLSGKDASRKTEKVLELLGFKLKQSKGQVELDRGEKKEAAKKQETASALAIDELGLQDALKAGKTYSLEIPYEWAAVYPDEKLWRETFYSKEAMYGGLAEAMLRRPRIARLYVGLSYLDRKTVSVLLSAVPLKTLEERYADVLNLYGPALAIQNGHAVVPGGPAAEGIWAQVAGASPAQADVFFRTLLERDGGRLLAYFFALSQLDREHQAFFTSNETRTAQFYKFFAGSEEARRGVSVVVFDTAFSKFLRSVPLDGHGHVDFPGSPEVWTVARGRAASGTQVAKMMKQVSKAVAPELEDAILLRLAETRYKDNAERHTELENFLAVARIDAHRAQPLGDASALVLAQNYADFSTTYAYLMEITGLSADDYARFFAVFDRIKSHSLIDANLRLGQFHSLIEWICLLQSRHAVDEAGAAKLFRYVCDKFAAADSAASYTMASMDAVRTILNFCKPEDKTPSADEKLRALFLGGTSQPRSRRSIDFQRVLEMQKAPSLDAMFAIYDTAANSAKKTPADFAALKKAGDELPSIELPKNTKTESKEKELIQRYSSAGLSKSLAELALKASKRKVNPKDVEQASQEVMTELEPQVTLALAGKIYAYYLRSTDLVVSEDALLLRKHRYYSFDLGGQRKELLTESSFAPNSQGLGSYFSGGFAQFPLAAGKASAAGAKAGGPAANQSLAAQIAAIRGTEWEQLQESDQRVTSLRIAVAREWIFEAARHADVFQALGEESMGLISLSRRADLLNGVESRNWRKVWDSITLPELFALGGKYLSRFKTDPWSSPVTSALRTFAAGNDGSRLNALGGITYHAFGCSHPHLVVDAPYEEYARQEVPTELAERSAEFKLFLAFRSDGIGLDPAALGNVAEVLALRAFRAAHMTDAKDWQALLAAYGTITPEDIKQAFEQ